VELISTSRRLGASDLVDASDVSDAESLIFGERWTDGVRRASNAVRVKLESLRMSGCFCEVGKGKSASASRRQGYDKRRQG